MSDECRCDAVAAEGLESDMRVLLGRSVHNGRRDRRFWRRPRLTARSDHPLLAVGLKVTDNLGNDADQLAGDVGDVLLRQLSLLAKAGRTAECRLELRRAELGTPHLRWLRLRGIAETELTEASELTLTGTAMHGRMLHLRLALQHSHDLRHDGQDLPHDLAHVLRT